MFEGGTLPSMYWAIQALGKLPSSKVILAVLDLCTRGDTSVGFLGKWPFLKVILVESLRRGGVLEPEGVVEIKFRTPDLLRLMHSPVLQTCCASCTECLPVCAQPLCIIMHITCEAAIGYNIGDDAPHAQAWLTPFLAFIPWVLFFISELSRSHHQCSCTRVSAKMMRKRLKWKSSVMLALLAPSCE
eukprot:1138082-Pelagomonas_calceolata.AAC.1